MGHNFYLIKKSIAKHFKKILDLNRQVYDYIDIFNEFENDDVNDKFLIFQYQTHYDWSSHQQTIHIGKYYNYNHIFIWNLTPDDIRLISDDYEIYDEDFKLCSKTDFQEQLKGCQSDLHSVGQNAYFC